MSIFKRLTSIAVPVVVLGVLVNEILTTPIYTDRELASFRERDVEMARRGEFDEALRSLKALSEIVPTDPLVWGDYLTVMTWAKHDQEAVQTAQDPKVPLLPVYALAELFDAAVRIGDFRAAQYFALDDVSRNAEAEKVALQRIRVLRDAGARKEAMVVLNVGLRRAPDSMDLLAWQDLLTADAVAQADASAAPAAPSSVPTESAPATAPAATVAPAAATAPAVVAAVPASGRGQPVKQRRPAVPKTAAPAVVARAAAPEPALVDEPAPSPLMLAAERARQAVRTAEAVPAADRAQKAAEALTELDTYVELLQAQTPEDGISLRNAKLDRVRALTLAGELEEAQALFESLGDPASLPPYGLLNGADLYARMGQPERAEQLLQLALQQAPDDAGILTTLFYNQLDREHYNEAGQTLARLQDISGEPVVNGRATWTARLAALFEAYQNHLQVAQERLEALRIHALNDPDLDLNLATIYRWRGWSAKALEEYKKAEADGADALAVETGRAQALFDLRRFDEADEKIAELVQKAPAHPDTIALQSQWDWFNKYLYIAQAQTGQSDANPVTGSSDLVFDQWLYSKPIANHYRVFAHHHYEWADFIEGPGGANRTGIGGDYRSEPYDVAVSLNRRSPGSRMGLTMNGEYRPDEQWTVFGDVQTDSQAVPLRGTRAGVDGHSGSIGVAYRWDERRNARASFSRADFSDGNVRETVSANLNQVVWVDARNSLMLSGDLYYSHASAGENVAYYNPASDRSAYLSADLSTILSRNADRTWSQRVNVGAGMHEQQNFSSRPIWSAQYEQRWQFGPSFGVNYGAMYRSRVYDGERERYGALFGGIQWRF